jgi:hypothetical protein
VTFIFAIQFRTFDTTVGIGIIGYRTGNSYLLRVHAMFLLLARKKKEYI